MRLIPFLLFFFSVLLHQLTLARLTAFPSLTGRQAIQGDGYGGEGFTVLPVLRDEEPATAIFIHGLGGTGEEWGFISLALSFFSLNFVKFIIPSAPEDDVTYLNQAIPSWFDIFVFGDTARVNKPDLLRSVDRIHGIIEGEIANGVAEDRIFIVGFSQGGALALTSFLRSRWSIAGCVGVATWLPLEDEYPEERSTRIVNKDILMLHGSEDVAVPVAYAEQGARKLESIGQSVNFTVLPGEPHVIINTEVITSIEMFIIARANGTVRYLKTIVNDLADTFDGLSERLDTL